MKITKAYLWIQIVVQTLLAAAILSSGGFPWFSLPFTVVCLITLAVIVFRERRAVPVESAGPLAVTAPKELTGADKDWLELVNGWAGLRTLEVEPKHEPEPEPARKLQYTGKTTATGRIVRQYADKVVREADGIVPKRTGRIWEGEDYYAEKYANLEMRGNVHPDGSVVVEASPTKFVYVTADAVKRAKKKALAKPCDNGTHAYSMSSTACLFCGKDDSLHDTLHDVAKTYGTCKCSECYYMTKQKMWR